MSQPDPPAGKRETREPNVVLLAGDPVQMGLAHGRLLGQEIRLLVAEMRRHIFRRIGGVRGAGLQIAAHALSLIMHRHIPPHLRSEMKAISEGSGVGYRDILLLNTLDDVLNVLRRLAPPTPALACSSFVLLGSRCRDGSMMHGRNLDYHFRGTPLEDHGAVARLLSRKAALFAFRPRGRAAFVSVGWPGVVGVTTAMSREGIALGNLTSYLRGTTPNGVPSGLLYRSVMEECSTLRDVGSMLRLAPRTIGNNLLVSSGREAEATLFEITRDSVEEVVPRDGALVVSNHFVSPALARRQRHFVRPHSVARWKRLQALCNRRDVELADALAFLRDTGGDGDENDGSSFNRVANEGTAVSVLFRPARMELWIGTGAEPPVSRGEFRLVDVAALLAGPDHSPDLPVVGTR